MGMFCCVTKEIKPFAANLLSHIPTKYYENRSTSDLVIAKTKRVDFFETQCSMVLIAICVSPFCDFFLFWGVCLSVPMGLVGRQQLVA